MNIDPRQGLPSASKFERIAECAGSFALESTVPETAEVEDEDAARGSRIHRAFETGDTLELSEEENEAYKAGVKFTNLILNNWKDAYNIISQQEGQRECRIWYHHPETLDPLASAQLDRHWIAPPYGLIVDLKSGWAGHVVRAVRSWQLKLQALCLWRDRDDIKFIRVAFARALSDVGANDWCDYTTTDLEFSEQSLLFRLWESEQPDAPRHAGKWCQYCKAMIAGICPEAAAHSMLPSVIASRAMAVTDKASAQLAVASLALPDLVKVWEVSTVVAHIITAVKARLKGMSKEELAELGLELMQGRRLDPITNVRDCMGYLVEQLKWPEHKLWEAVSISKTAIAALAQQEKGLSEKAAGEWVNKALAEFITPQRAEGALRRVK